MTDHATIHASIRQQCNHAQVRIASLLHLGAMLVDDDMSSVLEEVLEDVDLDDFQHIEEFAGLREQDPDDCFEPDLNDIAEYFYEHELRGFLVQFETPSNTYGSWGSCYLRWFYGDDLQDLVVQAAKWAGTVTRRD